jgi:hypothetical protein
MRLVICMAMACMVISTACGRHSQVEQSTQTGPQVEHLRKAESNDVESMLKKGKWQSRSGLSNGVAWKFADGGKVLIYDGGEVNESHQWKVISRNEGERKIRIKFWNPDETEHREWVFEFQPDGNPAKVDSFIYEGSRLKDSDEYLRYPIE